MLTDGRTSKEVHHVTHSMNVPTSSPILNHEKHQTEECELSESLCHKTKSGDAYCREIPQLKQSLVSESELQGVSNNEKLNACSKIDSVDLKHSHEIDLEYLNTSQCDQQMNLDTVVTKQDQQTPNGLVMEADPVILKMLAASHGKGGEDEEDDLSWYFDRSSEKDMVKKPKFDDIESMFSVVDFKIENTGPQQAEKFGNFEERPEKQSPNFQIDNVLELEPFKLKNENECSFELEDCLNGLQENQMDSNAYKTINSDIYSCMNGQYTYQSELSDQNTGQSHNKQFIPSEIISSKDLSQDDDEFIDCFEFGEYCRKGTEDVTHNANLAKTSASYEFIENQKISRSDENGYTPLCSNISTCERTQDSQTYSKPMVGSLNSTKLDELNVALSLPSMKQKYNVRENNLLSRHTLHDCSVIVAGDDHNLSLEDVDSEHPSSVDNEVVHTLVCNKDKSSSLEQSSKKFTTAKINFDDKDATPLDSEESASTKVEKLNLLLASIMNRKAPIETQQILISSRHYNKDMQEDCEKNSSLIDISDQLTNSKEFASKWRPEVSLLKQNEISDEDNAPLVSKESDSLHADKLNSFLSSIMKQKVPVKTQQILRSSRHHVKDMQEDSHEESSLFHGNIQVNTSKEAECKQRLEVSHPETETTLIFKKPVTINHTLNTFNSIYHPVARKNYSNENVEKLNKPITVIDKKGVDGSFLHSIVSEAVQNKLEQSESRSLVKEQSLVSTSQLKELHNVTKINKEATIGSSLSLPDDLFYLSRGDGHLSTIFEGLFISSPTEYSQARPVTKRFCKLL